MKLNYGHIASDKGASIYERSVLSFDIRLLILHRKVTKLKDQKRGSKTIDIVSYPLQVSVNGVTCVCSPFQVIRHILKFLN